MTPFQFLILTLAVYRAVRLALYDTITEPLRHRFFLTVAGDTGWRRFLTDLATCQWCFGVHVALWATVAWSLYDGWWTGWSAVVPFVAMWFALAASQSFLHLVEERLVGNN